jgi:predicted GIY-YIG superfamily endonuclease
MAAIHVGEISHFVQANAQRAEERIKQALRQARLGLICGRRQEWRRP